VVSTYDPDRWRRGLFNFRLTLTVPILRRSLVATAWSVVVQGAVVLGWLPTTAPLAHTLVGVAFGLLLVFRTNTSYDRFWEGRRLWGVIVEECRHLAQLAVVYLEPGSRNEFRSAVSVSAHAAMHALRIHRELGPNAEGLGVAAHGAVAQAAHVPTASLTRASQIVREAIARGAAPATVLPVFEESFRAILLAAGGCARIRATPIPFAYTVHLRRALILYAATIPFALAREFGWLAVPATCIVTFVLFGIEELGVSIEDPFGHDPNDLPLEQYCSAIDATLFDPSLDALAADAPAVRAAT
jgi:putative membrane protein